MPVGFICFQLNKLLVLFHWSIGHIVFQFNLLPIGGTNLLIYWTCLLLVGGCLGLGMVLADAVKQENPSQDSNNKYNGATNCNAHNSTCGSLWNGN